MINNFAGTAAEASQTPIPTPPDAYSHRPDMESVEPPAAMKPEIHFVGEMSSETDGPSPMSEVVDNDAADINPFDLTEQVGRARRHAMSSSSAGSSEEGGMVKELWGSMMDDVFGKRTGQ